jgi:hypothetical protein
MSTAKKLSVDAKACNAAASILGNAYAAAHLTGTIVAKACAGVAKAFKGRIPNVAELKTCVEKIAVDQDWPLKDEDGKPHKGTAVRKSEMRQVLRTYPVLPTAIAKTLKEQGNCDYHRSIQLARFIKELKTGTVAQKANKAAEESGKRGDKTPPKKLRQRNKADQRKRAIQCLTDLGQCGKLGKDFLKAVAVLRVEFASDLGE